MRNHLLQVITFVALLLGADSLAQAKDAQYISIIPYPQSIEIEKGSFRVSGASFNCDPSMPKESLTAVKQFVNSLSLIAGKQCSIATPVGIVSSIKRGAIKGFAFYVDKNLAPEEYVIDINKKCAVISASSHNGFLYAIQTIKQMLPVAIYGKTPLVKAEWVLPCCKIQDAPRFGYRGAHLDCARHFFSVDEVKRYINVMATYKLNRFHWHLTDDQGWRVEIKKYPELTQIGAFRSGTMIGRDFKSDDGKRYGGYYTQEQIKDIIAYAESLGIVIIPEIDLPGHMLGVLAAHPELGCSGGPYQVSHTWGIFPQVLCPGKEATFKFLEDVLGEIADLFPSEYIHIGGDECPKSEWEKCPDCQARIKELGLVSDEHASAEQRLQNYVTSRVQAYLSTKGKKIIGWDEILEGDLQAGATIMSWRGTKGGIEASSKGFDVIMSPNTYCYIDYYQSNDHEREPLAIGGYLPVEKTYSFDPYEGLDAAAQKHILGVQVNLWTEYIATPEHLEYMLLPRMIALSEVGWSSPQARDFDRFKTVILGHQFPILDQMGYNYCRAIEYAPADLNAAPRRRN